MRCVCHRARLTAITDSVSCSLMQLHRYVSICSTWLVAIAAWMGLLAVGLGMGGAVHAQGVCPYTYSPVLFLSV